MRRLIRLVAGLILVCTWFLSATVVHAVSNTIVLSPSQTSVTKGSEVQVAVKTNTTAGINGVQLKITYDTKYLQYVSISSSGTAFLTLLSEGPWENSVVTTRGTETGGNVSGTKQVITIKFKALANTNNTTLSADGRANSSNTPLTLNSTSVNVAITTPATSPKPASGSSGNGSGSGPTGGSSAAGSTDGAEGLPTSGEGSGEDGTSNGIADGSEASDESVAGESTSVVSKVLNPAKSIVAIKKNKPVFALVVVALLAVPTAGGWLIYRWLRKRKHQSQALDNSPVYPADASNPTQSSSGNVVAPTTPTDTVGSDWQASLGTLQEPQDQTIGQTISQIDTPNVISPTQPAPAVAEPEIVQPNVQPVIPTEPQVIQPVSPQPTPIQSNQATVSPSPSGQSLTPPAPLPLQPDERL